MLTERVHAPKCHPRLFSTDKPLMDLSEEGRFQSAPLPPSRLDNLARHPLGVVVRILAAAGAIFFGGVVLVLAAINYSSERPPDAAWTERALDSATVALLGLTVAVVVLVAAWRPTGRRLLGVVVVLIAVPLLARAL